MGRAGSIAGARPLTPLLEVALRALSAAGCGIILGLPYRNRPGGISTHALVALGAFVYCQIAEHEDDDDTLRVVQGVAQGVGFIGAAAVIKTRQYIVGITTAASIWIAGAIGCAMAVASPMVIFELAAATAVLNAGMRTFERKAFARTHRLVALDEHPPPT